MLIKIISIIIRFLFIIITFIIYFIALITLQLGCLSYSRNLLELASDILLFSLNIYTDISPKFYDHYNSNMKLIFVANHSSPLDLLLIQAKLKVRSITTSHNRLRLLFPFVDKLLFNYGHALIDHNNVKSKTSGLRKLSFNLDRYRKILIFPSGSLETKVSVRLSHSVSYLSFRHNALVIPLIIKYDSNHLSDISLKYKPIMFILKRLISPNIKCTITLSNIYNPNDFKDQNHMISSLKTFYEANT